MSAVHHPQYLKNAPSWKDIENFIGMTILDFGNDWCGHCQAASLSVQTALTDEPYHQWPHIKIADGKGKRLGRAFKVKLWPTLILLQNGKEVARLVRPTDVDAVHNFLNYES